jgi:hypothetical protein
MMPAQPVPWPTKRSVGLVSAPLLSPSSVTPRASSPTELDGVVAAPQPVVELRYGQLMPLSTNPMMMAGSPPQIGERGLRVDHVARRPAIVAILVVRTRARRTVEPDGADMSWGSRFDDAEASATSPSIRHASAQRRNLSTREMPEISSSSE